MARGFILFSKNGRKRVLSPFQNPKTGSGVPDGEFVWYCSQTPQADDIRDIEQTVFVQIDKAIDRWIQDIRYLPRLFAAAGGFLLLYFFFSFVVRDPVPVVDELIFAFAGAAGLWFWLSRRARKSDVSLRRRMVYKQAVSDARFVPDQDTAEAERWLDELEGCALLDLCDKLVRCRDNDLPQIDFELDSDFLFLLEEYFTLRAGAMARMIGEVEQARRDDDPNPRINGRLIRMGQYDRSDLALLGLIIRLKEKKNFSAKA